MIINVIEIMMGVIFYVYFSLCINKVTVQMQFLGLLEHFDFCDHFGEG